ncbi:MAG: single-stranded DNA-binding protein [Actinomycetota bacterium]|nr:single-stranded DNA-binding protein [Actinomycetota bacterium]MDH5277415.1 single-stranded DNA-binding protein [Actinomycetota bacterium]
MTARSDAASSTPAGGDPVNEVRLSGRVGAAPTVTTLPSGDQVVSFRLVVPRGRGDRRPPAVDTIDCSVWSAALRRRAVGWSEGDAVVVVGRLHRRFWRGPGGPRSWYVVDVRQGRRVRADATGGGD